MTTKTITLDMSWHVAAQILLTVLREGTATGKADAEAEIMRLAAGMDDANAKLTSMKAALEPFAHPDLREILGGTRPMDGEDENDAIIYQRNNAKLTVGMFRRAAEEVAE